MGIKLFLNDYYDLLKFMHDNEVINSMFSILQKQDYIEQKTRGKYVLTDKAENIIETIETLQ